MYSRTVAGRTLTLVPSGWTYRRTFVLYDRESGTLWYPAKDGLRGIQGKYSQKLLPLLPYEKTRWGLWLRKHPNSRLLY